MPTSEKFCLRWNDFQENVNNAFAVLRKDSDFTDVTLAGEDGHQVEAHKVILLASSPFFQKLLKRNKHEHPLIYMRGLKLEDLLAIVDFLYYGEANIYQENLDNFLNIAEELELKGLHGAQGGGGEDREYYDNTPSSATLKKNNTIKTKDATQNKPFFSHSEDQITSNTVIALPNQDFSGNIKDIHEQVETLIGRGENLLRNSHGQMTKAYVCNVCGKECGRKESIKDHIVASHLEGISLPCNLCEKTLKSRYALAYHKARCHSKSN